MVTLLNGFILVKKIGEEQKQGAIVTAQAVDDFIYRGEVVKIDMAESKVELGMAPGAVVYFRKDAGDEITIKGETLKAIKFEDIICYE